MARMAIFPRLPDFGDIFRQEVRCWLKDVLPRPDRRLSVDLSRVSIHELKEPISMPIQELAVNLSGDAPFGYEVTGIAFVNKAGNPADPAVADVVVTTSDDTVCGASYLGGGRAHLVPLDSAAVGATCTVTVSANETGTEDDARFLVTIVADRVGAVTLDGVTVAEATAPVVA
jgi:hypothetical protein